ncbi:hypothetical protein HHK36_009958 [Tetracentron sinense]|uniref:Uncharacterized protein n=1 Tax=Tetracentron sinense TaxID=13715 RepID=A0A835DIU3_TETSI|nr:hypothetical protein HHK36_009958 [Tetracentron sinense]
MGKISFCVGDALRNLKFYEQEVRDGKGAEIDEKEKEGANGKLRLQKSLEVGQRTKNCSSSYQFRWKTEIAEFSEKISGKRKRELWEEKEQDSRSVRCGCRSCQEQMCCLCYHANRIKWRALQFPPDEDQEAYFLH